MEIDKRIEIKQWNAVALWSWNVAVENCGICKNSINEACLECQANEVPDGDGCCTISWGSCNHAYHTHCINKWMNQKKTKCPLCQNVWTTVKTAK
jgi:RING-box protein 1